MATTSKNKAPGQKAKPKTTTKTTTKTTQAPEPKGVEALRLRAAEVAETAVDVPVGAALTVVDRVTGAVEPFTDTQKAEAELKRLRTQLRRELNKVERRGGTARRRTRTRVRKTRNRVEREVKQRRRRAETELRRQRRQVETQLRQNRRKAETRLRRAETDLKAARGQAERAVRDLVGNEEATKAGSTAA